MVLTQFEKPGGRIMKLKVVAGPGGIAVASNSYFPGDVFETDEVTGSLFIRQGRAVEVKEEAAEAAPSPPSEETEHHEEKKRGRK